MKFNKRLFGFLGALLIILGGLTQFGSFASAADVGTPTATSLTIPCSGGTGTLTYTGVSSIGASSVVFSISELGSYTATTVVGSSASATISFPKNHGTNDKYYDTVVKIDGNTVLTAENNIKVLADTITSFSVTTPTKANYYVGDTVDFSGAKITNVICAAGSGHSVDMNVTSSMLNVSQLLCTEVGTKTITVNYGTKSATFSVAVTAIPPTQLKPPTCTPDEGTYHRTKTVRLQNNPTDSGATIFYTTNGTVPTHNGNLVGIYTKKYNGSFEVKKDTTIKAISVKDGWADSNVATFYFDIDLDDDDDDDSTADTENEQWDDIAYDVLALSNNETYTVVMNKQDSAVPYDVLANILGRNINLKLDFGSFEWLISGKDMTYIPNSRVFYNMYVRSIYDNDIASLSGSDEVIQLELDHNGEFPGKFNLKVFAGYGYANSTLYLNYYNDRTYKLEQTAYATVDAYGYVTFPFTHASRYVVTKKNIAGPAAVTQTSQPSASSSSRTTAYTPPISWVYNPNTAVSASASSSQASSEPSSSLVASSSSAAVNPVDLPVQPATPQKETKPLNDYLGIVLIAAGSFLCGMTIFVAFKGLKR